MSRLRVDSATVGNGWQVEIDDATGAAGPVTWSKVTHGTPCGLSGPARHWAMLYVRAALAAALSICQVAAVDAQPATAASCRDLLASAPLLSDDPATAEPEGSDGCRFTGARFGLGQRFGYRIGTLVEHGIPFGALGIPQSRSDVRVEARGIAFELHSGQAKTDWLNRQSQTPFDMRVTASYDPAGQELILRELSLEGPAIGRTTLAFAATGVDGADPVSAGLRSLALTVDSRRFLVAFVLPSLLSFLPDDDPGSAVDRAKAQAGLAVRFYLPQAGATADTVAAVAGFIGDFPHPQHVFDLRVSASTPVTGAAIERSAASPAAASAVMRTLTVTASYAGEAR